MNLIEGCFRVIFNLCLVIVNKFANDVQEIIQEYLNELQNIEQKKAVKSQECQTDIIVRWEKDVEDIKHLSKMKEFYEKKTMKITHKMHLESFKFLAGLFNQNPSFTSLLLSMVAWKNYSKMLLLIYVANPNKTLTISLKNKGVQKKVET